MNPVVERILGEQNLVVRDVYRDGPRYWVGLVERDGAEMILKVVLDDTPWLDQFTGDSFRTSDQLLAEAEALEALEPHEGLAGHLPALVASGDAPAAWTLRSHVPGRRMSQAESPFWFKDEFYTPERSEALLRYVQSYQQMTPLLAGSTRQIPKSHYNQLRVKVVATGLLQPSPPLSPLAPAIRDYLAGQEAFHDSRALVLTHGEVYPPHVFFREDGTVSLIDWENVHQNNVVNDLMAVWIRGYDRPEWQESFYEQALRGQAHETEADFARLWRIELLLHGSGVMNYLAFSDSEPSEVRAAAIARILELISQVLSRP